MTTVARLAQRAWVSQYTPAAVLALAVQSTIGPIEPADSAAVTATMRPISDAGTAGEPVFTDRPTSDEGGGVYTLTLGSADTAVIGVYAITWSYQSVGDGGDPFDGNIDGGDPDSEFLGGMDGGSPDPVVAQTYVSYVEVGEASPTYDGLPTPMKEIVENIWWRFADLFDSPLGGPHLQVYMQSHFGRERLSQILISSIGRMNIVSQPVMRYGLGHDVDGQAPFPVASYGSMLESRGVIEVIKHLIRSYTEQPRIDGVATARADRRDYPDRWRQVLRDEEREYEDMLDGFKIAHMGLGRPAVAVAGGMYPRLNPMYVTRGMLAARGFMRVLYP